MKIGITGGIGSGKSTVSDYLIEKGYKVIDCDKLAREVVMPGKPALKKLVLAMGSEILNEKGELDRQQTARIVFDDADKRKILESITHAAILEEVNSRVSENPNGINFIDAALMFETGLNREMDLVWAVVCGDDIRIQRVMERDGASREMVLARMDSQMKDEERRGLADEILENSTSKEELYAGVDRLLEKISE